MDKIDKQIGTYTHANTKFFNYANYSLHTQGQGYVSRSHRCSSRTTTEAGFTFLAETCSYL